MDTIIQFYLSLSEIWQLAVWVVCIHLVIITITYIALSWLNRKIAISDTELIVGEYLELALEVVSTSLLSNVVVFFTAYYIMYVL